MVLKRFNQSKPGLFAAKNILEIAKLEGGVLKSIVFQVNSDLQEIFEF